MKQIILVILMIGEIFASGTIMIEVAYEGDKYRIIRAWTIEQTFPPTLQGVIKSKDDIVIELKNKNGKVVDELRIENPRIVRGILSEIDNEEGHTNIKNNKGSFVLRYAYDDGLKYLNIINADEMKKDINLASTPKNKVKSITNMEFGSLLKQKY